MRAFSHQVPNLLAAALAVGSLTAAGVIAQPTAPPPTTASPSADTLRPVERTFLAQGLERSRNEAEISRLALGWAADSGIREFAQQLATDYRQIATDFEALARRKTVEVPIQPASFPQEYRQLAATSGAAFDRVFVSRVAAASERMLRLCETTLAEAKDPDIRDLAGSLLPTIRGHVNKATEMQKSF